MLNDYYDRAVIIQRKTTTDNGFGGVTETWADHLTVPALIDYVSGHEKQIAAQYQEDTTHIMICEAGYDITNTDRVNDGSDIYRILHVDEPFGKHMEILLQYVGVDNG